MLIVDDEHKPDFPNVTVTNDLDNAITEVEIRKTIGKLYTKAKQEGPEGPGSLT